MPAPYSYLSGPPLQTIPPGGTADVTFRVRRNPEGDFTVQVILRHQGADIGQGPVAVDFPSIPTPTIVVGEPDPASVGQFGAVLSGGGGTLAALGVTTIDADTFDLAYRYTAPSA